MPVDETNELVKVRKLYGRVYTSSLISHVHFAPLIDSEHDEDISRTDWRTFRENGLSPQLSRIAEARPSELEILRRHPRTHRSLSGSLFVDQSHYHSSKMLASC